MRDSFHEALAAAGLLAFAGCVADISIHVDANDSAADDGATTEGSDGGEVDGGEADTGVFPPGTDNVWVTDGAMGSARLLRFDIESGDLVEIVLDGQQSLADVEEGPDGLLYVSMPHMGGPSGHVHPFDAATNQLLAPFGDIPEAWGFEFVDPDRLLIAAAPDRVVSLDLGGGQFDVFHTTGFVPPLPRDIARMSDQNLAVTSSDRVFHIDSLGAQYPDFVDAPTLSAMGGNAVGVDWHDDGYLVVVAAGGVFRIPGPGLPPEVIVDTAAGELVSPQFVDIGPPGFLYVSDQGNDDVAEIDPITGEVRRRFGQGILNDPLGVLVN